MAFLRPEHRKSSSPALPKHTTRGRNIFLSTSPRLSFKLLFGEPIRRVPDLQSSFPLLSAIVHRRPLAIFADQVPLVLNMAECVLHVVSVFLS